MLSGQPGWGRWVAAHPIPQGAGKALRELCEAQFVVRGRRRNANAGWVARSNCLLDKG
jgi:hypothetical protein